MKTKTSPEQNFFRNALGAFMLIAGIGHLTFARETFQVQVPDWIPMDKDLTVILSGVAEIMIALLLLFWKSKRREMGIFLAVFYILIFPGNVHQFTSHLDGFGLDSDNLRFFRLLFQPVLVLWALWSTGVIWSSKERFRH